jgi:hypothetical protein
MIMRVLSVVLGLSLSVSAHAGEKASVKVDSPHTAKKPAAKQAKAPKKKRKGARFDLRRSRDPRGKLFRDWDSGLQFAVAKGKLRKLKKPKEAQGIVWETQVTVGSIAIRTRADTIDAGTYQSAGELKDYLEGISLDYRDPENVRDVVVLESDMLDSMGLTEAGATLDVVLPKGKHCCEQLWVLVRGTTRVTMSVRCTNSDYRRRWTAFQDKFLEALKIANTDNWK